MNAQLYFGEVMHSRLRPRHNRFRYPVFFLRFPLSRMDGLRAPLLGLDRWNLVSVHRRDHGARDGSDLEAWVRTLLRAEGLDRADGEIWLQAFPRVLGYVFNPVSFWLCHDRAGGLRAVLCEVSNTFGERHNYLLAHPDQRCIEPGDWLSARKVFHVSPFCEVRGSYRFQFVLGGQQSSVRIDYHDGDRMLLVTAVRGRPVPLTTRALVRAFVVYPWMTLAVIARIHWQALKLWRKGVPFFRKPLPPVHETTR
jgi:DUF1365 family protein